VCGVARARGGGDTEARIDCSVLKPSFLNSTIVPSEQPPIIVDRGVFSGRCVFSGVRSQKIYDDVAS